MTEKYDFEPAFSALGGHLKRRQDGESWVFDAAEFLACSITSIYLSADTA
jgi:hypothetical protein